MNYDSVLNGSAMAGQCREMASRLKQEIDFYSFEISAINTFIESKASGEAATALKNKAEKLIQMLQIVISANEYDIHDCNILAEMVDGITIDGYEVLTRKQEARNNAEECYNQAAYYSRVASECIISSIGNHFYELANTYRGYATSWERIEDALHKIENQYDDIDCTSSTLFKDGYETRCLLDNDEYDVSLLNCTIPTVKIKGGNTTTVDSDVEELSDDDLIIKYSFLYNHLQRTTGLSENEALGVLKELADKHRLESFWATYRYSRNDYNILLKNLDLVIFERQIFEELEWPMTHEEIDELNQLFWDFGITDKYSIACFVLCCNHETIRHSQNTTGSYLDKNGYQYSEEYGASNAYAFNERGIGYLQVTFLATQKKAYKYLVEHNYIEPSESANDTNGYVDALAQNPWAVSVWYWAKHPKTGENLTLNQYVVNAMKDDDFEKFSVGLPFVCESFNYGTVTAEANEYLHDIARGKNGEFNTYYNSQCEYNCLMVTIDDDTLYSNIKTIERYADFNEAYKRLEYLLVTDYEE